MQPLGIAQTQTRALLLPVIGAGAGESRPLFAPARDSDMPLSSPPSFLQAARNLSTPQHPLPLIKQIKFFLRACRRPWKMRAWLDRLAQPDLARAFREQPRLALKPFLSYINYAWTPAERRALLDAHYEIITHLLAPEILARACRGGHDLLHIVNTTTGRRLVVRFLCSDKFEREGDLALNLLDAATGLTLANISFSIGYDKNDARRIYIGGLQACPDPRVRALIHDLAKELHGLRAKALLLWILQQLALRWNVASIYAVDDAHHTSNYRDKHHKVSVSYDEFWAESEGGHLPNGFWCLPLRPRERAREELKVNKRRQYERRYALLADLRESLRAATDRCAPGAPSGERGTVEFFHATPAPAAAPAAASAEARERAALETLA